jgi:hypothetical protein
MTLRAQIFFEGNATKQAHQRHFGDEQQVKRDAAIALRCAGGADM